MSETAEEVGTLAQGKGPPPPKGKGKGPPAPKGKGGPPPPKAADQVSAGTEVAPGALEKAGAAAAAAPGEDAASAATPLPKGKGKGKGPGPPAAKGKGGPPPPKAAGLSYKERKEAEQRAVEDRLSAAEGFTGKQLTAEEAHILEEKGTEAQGVGEYDKFQPLRGYFACRKCGKPIYSHQAKFESGCGWPAFDKCYSGSINTKLEDDGTGRVEITCAECAGHLGHVFLEPGHNAKARSDQRHCANSLALQYVKHDPPPGLSEDVLVLPQPSAADVRKAAAATVTVQIKEPGDGVTFAKIEDKVAIHYVGLLASTSKEFDSSLGGDPFEFVLGQGTVIKGWEEGVLQMPLGSKAKLLVPASLGYGAQGMPGAIPPGADLIFDVELVSISGKAPTAAAPSDAVPAEAAAPAEAASPPTIEAKAVKEELKSGGTKSSAALLAFQRGVRKAISMRSIAAAFQRPDARFTAANAVGALEATLAEEEEYAALMARWENRRGRSATVGQDLNNTPDAIPTEAVQEALPPVPTMRWRSQPGAAGPSPVMPLPDDANALSVLPLPPHAKNASAPALPVVRRTVAFADDVTSDASPMRARAATEDAGSVTPKTSLRVRSYSEAVVLHTEVQHFTEHQSATKTFTFAQSPPRMATNGHTMPAAKADVDFLDAVTEFKECVKKMNEAIARADGKSARELKIALRALIANATTVADKLDM